MERIYSAYTKKIERNDIWAKQDPISFATTLNIELQKLSNKKLRNEQHATLPHSIRIYGSGDFIPSHLIFMQNLNFNFYLISKSLTYPQYSEYISKLLVIPNLTSIVLSFDNLNLHNYNDIAAKFQNVKKIKYGYTGNADEYDKIKNNHKFTIFFNTDKTKKGRLKARKFTEQCPCDSGIIPLKKACAACNKCWRSTDVR